MSAPTLLTTRLRLRPLTSSDAKDVMAIFGDPEVMRYWNTPPLHGNSEALAMIERIVEGYQGNALLQLGIEHEASGRIIGTCTLHSHHVLSRRAELGYALHRAAWGKGYMHEALARFVAFAFDEWMLNRLEADIDPANAASARSLERLGFQKEGVMPERWIVDGAFSDSAMYGLLEKRWRGLQAKQTIATASTPCF